MTLDLLSLLDTGIELKTSGTTGSQKTFYQNREKLVAANRAAIDSQEITQNSKIYTVCKMQHAGGLLAQTLPALSIGATVDVESFNPFTWVRKISAYTHTHLTPAHCNAIMSTKGFEHLDLSNVWITCGSDPVTWEMIESFVKRGATFMANWGMTEIGPTAINKVFRSLDEVNYSKYQSPTDTILGNRYYCDYKVVDGELYVKGDISVFGNEWYATGDMVQVKDNDEMFYLGRKLNLKD